MTLFSITLVNILEVYNIVVIYVHIRTVRLCGRGAGEIVQGLNFVTDRNDCDKRVLP